MKPGSASRFGSSKPVSESELIQARNSLQLLKARIARDPPQYFPQYNQQASQGQNFRRAFKPQTNVVERADPPPQRQEPRPINHAQKVPGNNAVQSSQGISQYNLEGVQDIEQPSNLELQPCPDCGRTFNPQALAKHVNNCKKVFVSKRKAFDSSKMRNSENPEAGMVQRRTNNRPEPKKVNNAKWKNQSEQFRANMRAARLQNSSNTEAYEEAARQAQAYEKNSLVPCPHCGRTFNEHAAERHIPICQRNQKANNIKRGGATTRAVRGRR